MTTRGPLVTVMMPCFNAERTLPMALASLRAQKYERWEAVVVDDGSTDETSRVLAGVSDGRIRVERFAQNRGRGAARARALEMAKGDLLAFLDADDWWFPEKLAYQVAAMRAHPEVVALGAASVITDATGEPVGEMGTSGAAAQLVVRRFDRLGPPPIGFPSCIVRIEEAREAGFNPEFRRSQDSDFLIRVMLGRAYASSTVPLYAYSQAEAASLQKTLEGYRYRVKCYRQYTDRFPVQSRKRIAGTMARAALYKTAALVHVERRLIARRWMPLSPDAEAAFQNAKRIVSANLDALLEAS